MKNWIFSPFQECSDPNVLGNLLAIFRELLAARTEWRPSALHHILSLEATDVISRLLVRVCKPGTGSPTLSDHSFICCFWILSALATKGKQTAAKKWENKSWYKISVANWQLAKVWIHWKWFHVKSNSRQKTRVKQGYFLANHKKHFKYNPSEMLWWHVLMLLHWKTFLEFLSNTFDKYFW